MHCILFTVYTKVVLLKLLSIHFILLKESMQVHLEASEAIIHLSKNPAYETVMKVHQCDIDVIRTNIDSLHSRLNLSC